MLDFNLIRWVALVAGFIFIALCYKKNANHAELAFWIAISMWIFSVSDLAASYGHSVIH